MGVLRHSYFFADLQTILQEYGLACKNFFNLYNKVGRNGGIPPPSALWAMCITPRLMELWATLFAGCGKAAFAFPYAVNGVVHSGMGSYAHCPRCFFCF